jgi:inner membrane protein
MDSITHIALGAVIGEVCGGRTLGRKAMLVGAIAQSLPDVDFLMSLWLTPVDNLLAHRGFTHSFLFCLVFAFVLGYFTHLRFRSFGKTARWWMLFFGLQIFIHLLLDGLNNYGVGWFEPFSHYRVALDVIYVADPFFSVWIGIGFVFLLVLRSESDRRRIITWLSLSCCIAYLGYAVHHKLKIERQFRNALTRQNISYSRILTTPTPLNNWLWYLVAETDEGYQVGYKTVIDNTDSTSFTYFPRQSALLNSLEDREVLDKLLRFSKGWYTVQRQGDALLFNDLRFGQIAGWSNPHAMFAFHYDLIHPDANLFVVQQGRFSSWNRETVMDLYNGIRGKY